MKKKIILIGAGGHAKSCIDVIESEGKFKIVGLIDNLKKIGTKISGYEVMGKDKELEKFKNLANYAFITIGQIKSPNLREKSFNTLKKYGFKIPYICSPKSIISKHSIIAEGVIVHHGAIINSGTEIGRNCIINTNSLIEHNCKIGQFSQPSQYGNYIDSIRQYIDRLHWDSILCKNMQIYLAVLLNLYILYVCVLDACKPYFIFIRCSLTVFPRTHYSMY